MSTDRFQPCAPAEGFRAQQKVDTVQAPTPENENDAVVETPTVPGAACAKIALMLRGLETLAAARDLSNADRASARTQVQEIAGLLSQSRNPDLIALH